MSEVWSVVYKRAIQPDGSLLFPERLSKEFLENARRTMGSYLFANQYMNEVVPDDEKSFKPQWLRYYSTIPQNVWTFAFIDPAIGQRAHNDYTGIAVVDVDSDGVWYLKLAARYRLTPTEIVSKMFDLHTQFKIRCIGVEIVAYQEALLYMLDEEMKRRRVILPVTGIRRTSASKQSRILGLVPRFEWGRLLAAQGMTDFEDEYNAFPRGAHDDIIDAASSLESIISYPQKETINEKPHSPTDPNYERWYINNLGRNGGQPSQQQDEY